MWQIFFKHNVGGASLRTPVVYRSQARAVHLGVKKLNPSIPEPWERQEQSGLLERRLPLSRISNGKGKEEQLCGIENRPRWLEFYNIQHLIQ